VGFEWDFTSEAETGTSHVKNQKGDSKREAETGSRERDFTSEVEKGSQNRKLRGGEAEKGG
jgi:hypothetical protein